MGDAHANCLCVRLLILAFLLYQLPPSRGDQEQPTIVSRNARVQVSSDVRGNLGSSQVIVQDPPGVDWLKDRWQAASDMGGTAIKGEVHPQTQTLNSPSSLSLSHLPLQ